MKKIFQLIITLLFITPIQSLQASQIDKIDFLLTRVSPEEQSRIDYARCFSKHSVIKYKNDIVYSEEEYDNLKANIEGRHNFLNEIYEAHKKSQPKGNKIELPNFMTAILVATGKKNNKIKRVFSNLYVRKKKGKYTFCSNTDLSKFVVFYSNHNQGVTVEGYNLNPIVRLDDLELEKNKNKNSTITTRVRKANICSHTEPLCLSAILSLDKDTFKSMLSEGYNLTYYEIHLISYLDACDFCPQVIYKNIPKIKKLFGKELFLFFHAYNAYHPSSRTNYPKLPYALKFKKDEQWKYIDGQIPDYQFFWIAQNTLKKNGLLKKDPSSKKYSLRRSTHLNDIPNYYFSFIDGLENEEIKMKGAERKIQETPNIPSS